MPSAPQTLEAEALHLWRSDVHVLRGLSFSLQEQRCLQVIGPNGAGKSTLLRALAGLLPLESGAIRWRGLDIHKDHYSFHRELAWLSHGTGLKGELSAHENLHYSAGLRRALHRGQIDAALARVGYVNAEERLAKHMSLGQQRRVALARVLLLDCPLWLLDEPTSNLDRQGQDMFGEILAAHLSAGGLAVIATHQALALPVSALQNLELS